MDGKLLLPELPGGLSLNFKNGCLLLSRKVTTVRVTSHFILLVTIVFFSSDYVSARESISKREENRRLRPVEKLKGRLERPARIKQMQPEKVMDVLGVRKGERIADVGAGTGFFSFRFAARVGSEGKVYAVEIEDELLEYIRDKMKKTGLQNIVPIKSSESSSNLPPASCDKILFAGAYYYLPDPVSFMIDIRKSLKPGGLVTIIGRDPAKVDGKEKSKLIPAGNVIEDMKRAGFVLRESHDFIERKYFLVFSAAVESAER